jgi:putative glycosyltransferase (TIGR04372 family)
MVVDKHEYHFHRGEALLSQNRPFEAWEHFSGGKDGNTNHHFFMIGGACLQQGLGRAREGIAWHRRSDDVRRSRGVDRKRDFAKYWVLNKMWIEHFGHAAQVDYIVKLGVLEGRDPMDTIVYCPPDLKVANRFLVEQWSPYLRLVKSARDLPFPESEVAVRALNFFVPRTSTSQRQYLWELAAQVYRRWTAEGRGPLLVLPPDVASRGRQALQSCGIPPDAWFVSLHVRDRGYQSHHRGLHDVLNSKVRDYLPAMEEITRRGGWVIRMGDVSMPPLPAIPNVLDYCHGAIRSDWMDVFLTAACRFFIGTSSGVCYAAQDYGVPCVLTNWWPPAQRPWQSGDIFVPKRIRWLESGKFLSLKETLAEPFGYCNSLEYLWQHHGAWIKDNDPEDIRAAVVEMLERVEGTAIYTAGDLAARERAEAIYASVAKNFYNSPAAFGASALARDFIRRNPAFLEA